MTNTKLVSLHSVTEIIENAIPDYGEHRLVKLDVIKNIQQLPTQEAQEWISIKECGFPEDEIETDYLTYQSGIKTYKVATWLPEVKCFTSLGITTHYKPLPLPPT